MTGVSPGTLQVKDFAHLEFRNLSSSSGSHSSREPIAPPRWTEGSQRLLHLESTLQDLALCQFDLDSERLGSELAEVFVQYPLLIAATLRHQGQFAGLISRRQFLEYLIRPHGFDLFLREPLRVLQSYAQRDGLRLAVETPILVAAQQALRRSPDQQSEPILVQIDRHTFHLLDSQSLNIAYWQLRGIETQVRYERAQAQMIQSDKMASLGRLVDGVAHEILDPVSFIWGNLTHVTAYSESLLSLLAAYEEVLPELPPSLLQLRSNLEVDYLSQDLPQTIASIRTGAERLSKLATSLQNFCHIDEVYPKPADLHELLDGILLLLKSRLSSEIHIVTRYGDLPPVPCYAGQLNQVFMNILSNAVDALLNAAVSQKLALEANLRGNSVHLESTGTPAFKPTIAITTQVRSLPKGEPLPGDAAVPSSTRWVSICIANNGLEPSPAAQKQLLDSLSIERRAMKETSLAVSYQIVTAKHGGRFEVRFRNPALLQEPDNGLIPNRGCLAESQIEALAAPRSTLNSSCFDKSSQIGTEFEILLPLA